LKKILIKETQRKKAYYNLEVQRRNGKFIAIDHSFKVTKHMQHFGESKVFEGLFSGLNELGEVRLFQFVKSTSLNEVKLSLQNYYKTSTTYGCTPQFAYTDRCCQDRGILEESMDSLKFGLKSAQYEQLKLPPSKYEYLNNIISIQTKFHSINCELDSMGDLSPKLIIGLDTEWNRADNGMPRQRIGLIQIAFILGSEEKIYLISTKNFDLTLPPALSRFLQRTDVHKYGSFIHSADIVHLADDWNCKICPEGQRVTHVFATNHLAYEKQVVGVRNKGLARLCELLLGKTLKKVGRIFEFLINFRLMNGGHKPNALGIRLTLKCNCMLRLTPMLACWLQERCWI